VGFSDDEINKARPALNERNQEAARVWREMGGWFPERLPVILAFVELEHFDGLWERLSVIRDTLSASASDE
jgi:hypothetical protein